MSPAEPNQLDIVARFSRRQLWWLLIFMVVLGAAYVADAVLPHGTPNTAVSVIFFVIIASAAWPPKVRWGSAATKRAMAILDDDELRKLAQAKAFRNGFLVQALYPVSCGYALIALGVANPWPFAVGSSAWLGFVTFLASMLWYDR